MKAIGIICEYNPFHNGHLYHIEQIKKMYPNHIIILVVSGPFTQRGDISILTKWEKTEIALTYGVDLVIELPFIFATGSADTFAHGAIAILHDLQVEYLIFGSEENNIEKLTMLASIQKEKAFHSLVQTFIKVGLNYPTALSKSLQKLSGTTVSSPNDLLGISYIKEIQNQNTNIKPITIQRTNQYHSESLEKIASASSIRTALKEKKDISICVPLLSKKYIHPDTDIENLFEFLKYKIISESNYLLIYHEVNEALISRMKQAILTSDSLDEFIKNIKTKNETYNKLKRICLYILCSLTKEEAKQYLSQPYIRILGFTESGKKYLNQIKKEVSLPIISNYANDKNHLLNLDLRIHQIYTMAFSKEIKMQLLESEIKQKPIYKKSNECFYK